MPAQSSTTQQEIDAAAATLRQAQAQVLQTEAQVAQAEPAWVLTSYLVANGIVLTISG